MAQWPVVRLLETIFWNVGAVEDNTDEHIENVHKVSFMDFILPEHVYYYEMFLISAKCFLLYILRN